MKNYCPKCQVQWKGRYMRIGVGVLCPMPRPPEAAQLYSTLQGYRCGTPLIEKG